MFESLSKKEQNIIMDRETWEENLDLDRIFSPDDKAELLELCSRIYYNDLSAVGALKKRFGQALDAAFADYMAGPD